MLSCLCSFVQVPEINRVFPGTAQANERGMCIIEAHCLICVTMGLCTGFLCLRFECVIPLVYCLVAKCTLFLRRFCFYRHVQAASRGAAATGGQHVAHRRQYLHLRGRYLALREGLRPHALRGVHEAGACLSQRRFPVCCMSRIIYAFF
jgi:hypothetical protein